MTVALMACSAMVELVGFWDAQIMANHTAWQVGRIAMVRGTDGMAFANAAGGRSKTGVKTTAMPDALKKTLSVLSSAGLDAGRFNDRGVITTVFMMSTCGIGYYGASPGESLAKGFKALIESAIKAITEGIPEAIKNAIKDIKFPSIIPGASGLDKIIKKILDYIIEKIVDVVLKPITSFIEDLLRKAFEAIFGKDGCKIDELFDGKTAGARRARQLYGAASRIARIKKNEGVEAVVLKDMDDLKAGYLFAKRSINGRMVYPQVVDKEAKSDGYFVTGAHGWPANDMGLAMVQVQINWPYEAGWLFPVVSGYGVKGSKPPLVTGHSMVFPQPNIIKENLYSQGATSYDPGSYTNDMPKSAFEEIAREMKDYLRYVHFCTKFRICQESLSFKDGKYHWGSATWWKYIPELHQLWPFDTGNGDSYPVGGDYGKCWNAITDNADQDKKADTLNDKGYFKPWSYHNRDYFHWDGSYHSSYHSSIIDSSGNAGLYNWYQDKRDLVYSGTGNAYSLPYFDMLSNDNFLKLFQNYQYELAVALSHTVDQTTLYNKLSGFAKRNNVNMLNLAKWQTTKSKPKGHWEEGYFRWITSPNSGWSVREWVPGKWVGGDGQTISSDEEAWRSKDTALEKSVKTAEGSFAVLKRFVENEIVEIENILNDREEYKGDEDDPVFDPDDEKAIRDPEAAKKAAREKWERQKVKLRAALKQVDAAAVALRDEWGRYCGHVTGFKNERKKAANYWFAEGCIKAIINSKSLSILDSGHEEEFALAFASAFPYNITAKTEEMARNVKEYQDKLNDAYKKEVEYGALLGLNSAKKAKKEGKTLDDIVDKGDHIDDDKPGSLAPGSDTGYIIDKDKIEYSGGAWQWR